jgi:hypothetical protein
VHTSLVQYMPIVFALDNQRYKDLNPKWLDKSDHLDIEQLLVPSFQAEGYQKFLIVMNGIVAAESYGKLGQKNGHGQLQNVRFCEAERNK